MARRRGTSYVRLQFGSVLDPTNCLKISGIHDAAYKKRNIQISLGSEDRLALDNPMQTGRRDLY